MHRDGHIGAALLAYAPIGGIVLAVGFQQLAIFGGIAAVGLAMLPDWDMRVPGVPHRGPTHTYWFAGVVGVAVGGVAFLGGLLASTVAITAVLGLGVFGVVVGTVTMLSHIGADALTPMGVDPHNSGGENYSLNICRADSTLGNYALLGLGVTASMVAFVAGTGINGLL